jgi:CRP/FNR family transcriptional regulator, polysaccharide utilization system transcription regulator
MRTITVSANTQSELLALGARVTAPKGTVLFRRGEPSFGVFLVAKGRVGLRLDEKQGKSSWNRTASKGSIVGLPATLAATCYSLTAVTLEQAELAFIDRTVLVERIKSDPSLGLELICILGDEVIQMRTIMASTPLTTRLAAFKVPAHR